MQYHRLGAGARQVSRVGYGAMHLSITGRPDEATAIRTVHAALDRGVTLIDTADVYCIDHNDIGHNERLIRKALDQWPGGRDRITVATKAGLTRPGGRWTRDGRPGHIRAACDASLMALGVDRIDLYQFHAPDPRVPFAESIGAFRELRDEGKVRWLGLSNVTVSEIEEASEIAGIHAVQNRLSPFFREAIHDGVLGQCERMGIAFLAYSPVGGGRLNRRLPRHPVVGRIAAAHGVSPHAVVLAWVLASSPSVVAIPSARSPAHAADAASATGIRLSPGEMRKIDRADFPTG